MRQLTSGEPSIQELNLGFKETENSVGLLESSPITRATTATAVEVCSNGDEVIRPTFAGKDFDLEQVPRNMTAPPSAPLVAEPTKKRNLYVVSAFCSLGGFLFGADTGKLKSVFNAFLRMRVSGFFRKYWAYHVDASIY